MNVIDYINTIADENVTILIYEVQDRYYLRSDLKVLSLDGITDGKVDNYYITFRCFFGNIKTRNETMTTGFAGYEELYRLDYD
jgi:predicted type IV restriction endonuclease